MERLSSQDKKDLFMSMVEKAKNGTLDMMRMTESYYVYADGKKSEFSKYDFDNSTRYLVYESKPLFSKTKYRIEKTN